jgi:hypothetical protein
MAPTILDRVSNPERHLLSLSTHNPSHGNPHANSPPQSLANEERQDTPREGSQVVYRHDDALEATARAPEGAAPVFVAYDARKDSLIVTEQD